MAYIPMPCKTALAGFGLLAFAACSPGPGAAAAQGLQHVAASTDRMSDESCSPAVSLDLSGPRPTVAMTLADGSSRTAVFDTGAMGTIVNDRFAQDLGLANEGPLAPPFHRHSGGFQSTLRGARMGPLALPDISVPVMASPLPDIPLVVSPNAFRGRYVVLDFGTASLRVCPKNSFHRPQSDSYGYTPGPFVLPSIPVTIGDLTVNAHLDTGSGNELIFPTSWSERLDLSEPLRQVGVARMHSGESPIYGSRIRGEVRVGPLTLTDPEVRFTAIIPDVNVGMGLLRRLIVTLDPEEQRVWAVPAQRDPQT